MSAADICRRNGWTAGTRLRGRAHGNGYVNEVVIEVTAVGRDNVLAVTESNRSWDYERGPIEHSTGHESNWTLDLRNWVPA